MDEFSAAVIRDGTLRAIREVTNPRLFKSERGYVGCFHASLTAVFDQLGLIDDERILEVEYQKRVELHHTSQRPDVIYHVPVELSRTARHVNNFAVWAFKLKASPKDARDDFDKLDLMFEALGYPIGFFVNIDAGRDLLEHYRGPFADRLFGVSVTLDATGAHPTMRHCSAAPFHE